MPRRKRKRRRLGDGADGKRLRATHPNHVWALDFQADETADGRQIRLLNVVDEFTREALAMDTERSITSEYTVRTLERLICERGVSPAHVRCDNGPELVAHALRRFCREQATETAYIEPGAPWQNPFCESFNSTVRDELLDVELFANLAEAKLIVEDWRRAYNRDHHHSALGMLTPNAFAARWREVNDLEQAA